MSLSPGHARPGLRGDMFDLATVSTAKLTVVGSLRPLL